MTDEIKIAKATKLIDIKKSLAKYWYCHASDITITTDGRVLQDGDLMNVKVRRVDGHGSYLAYHPKTGGK